MPLKALKPRIFFSFRMKKNDKELFRVINHLDSQQIINILLKKCFFQMLTSHDHDTKTVMWFEIGLFTSRCTSFTSANNIAQRGHRQHLSYFQQQQQNGPYVTVRYVNLPAQLFGCLQAEHLDPREHSSYATNATTGLKKKTSQLASGSTRQDVCPWRPRFRALARSSRPA